MSAPVETFTAAERERLAPHVTSLEAPVFALVNLPETVKGALFARYSRYPGTLRRLFLDEFADSVPEGCAFEDQEGSRAAELYERIFLGYGDDSVAQLGGVHVACEWVSNVLTKVLQRPRLGAYLEQSTRYIAYDRPMEGTSAYRYFRDDALGPDYAAAMEFLFDSYAAALPRVLAWAEGEYPRRDGDSPAAHTRACRAKALDLLRGLLPAASLSHMGIYATGQTYEQLILHLLAHPLPEARRYGQMILTAVQAVIPSFVTRVERPDRGGRWVEYLRTREAAGRAWAGRLGLDEDEGGDRPSVRLLRADGDEDDLLAALLFEAAGVPEEDIRDRVSRLPAEERAAPARRSRRRRARIAATGRAAATRRCATASRSSRTTAPSATSSATGCSPCSGSRSPPPSAPACRRSSRRRAWPTTTAGALERSRAAWEALVDAGHDRLEAQYPLCLGFRIRYVLDLNAREAMQLIELRSGREGHPTYRAVAHAMHDRIAEVHPAVAASMRHVDRETEPRLERILSELRTQARAATR